MPYLDHAATTPLDPRVLEEMMPYLTKHFGNASSVHTRGRRARHAVESARERVAACIGASSGEIVFTSGGTEADNLALFGVAHATGLPVVTSSAEHEAVLRAAERLREDGHRVAIVAPEPSGAPSAARILEAVGEGEAFVSVMHANNEVGTVSPVRSIATRCRDAGGLVHTDAVQSAGALDLNVDELAVDLLSISAHKIYGPKGAGALYVRSGTPFDPHLVGGAQERRRRGGTENVAAVVGLARALELAVEERDARNAHLSMLRDRLIGGLKRMLDNALRFNTPLEPSESIPHIVSVSFPPTDRGPVDGEMLLLNMDMAGVAVSAGSACTSGAIEPSHVLLAMGLDRPTAAATIRFSMGKDTRIEEIDEAAATLFRTYARVSA